MAYIIVEENQKVTTVRLNRDDKRNAFNAEMSNELVEALHKAQKQHQRAFVIKANDGVKIWSAGHDLTELVSVEALTDDPMFEMFKQITHANIPVIAMVDGAVYAGALHLLIVCDIVLATNNSPVIMTANKMGVPFNPRNYSHWLRVIGMHKVKELFFTAAPISAQDAYVAGIYNHVLEKSKLKNKLDEIVENILNTSAQGIADTKLQLNTLARNISLTYAEFSRIEEHRQSIFHSEEFRNRIQALIDKIQHK
jgi:enoyl-CoA hydratase/carnithine racemase